MDRINWKRLGLGTLAAGVVMWFVEGSAVSLYVEQMTASMQAHNLKMDGNPAMFAFSFVVSLIAAFNAMFCYAASRPGLGFGPKTAVTIATVL